MKRLFALWLAAFTWVACLWSEENLIPNGSFENKYKLNGWDGMKKQKDGDRDFTIAPEMLDWETEDTWDNSAGALKVRITKDPDYVYWSHQAGARCLLRRIVSCKDYDVSVSFYAKSLSGSPYLNIARWAGGGGIKQPIELSKEWKYYEAIIPIAEDAPLLVFTLVPSDKPDHPVGTVVAEGEFLLDDVVITEISKGKTE
ncbi:MAG: hypothetical protein HY360_02295 [Verrucomicrobia bacterium]|nr:hypothetical protein [Verrucomicrobiota bacterium]